MLKWQIERHCLFLGPGLGSISPHFNNSYVMRICWNTNKITRSIENDPVIKKYIIPIYVTLSCGVYIINKNKN